MHFPSIEGTFSVITFTRSFWGKKKVVFVVEEEVMGRLAGGGEGGEGCPLGKNCQVLRDGIPQTLCGLIGMIAI